MDSMEQKLNAILGNPEMMSQLMAMAQSMSTPDPQPSQESVHESQMPVSIPGIDLAMVQKMAVLAQQANIDSNQQTLLRALIPYLSNERIEKLEKAMRAAKLAGLATTVLKNAGTLFPLGR